jgi:hypothetical protein
VTESDYYGTDITAMAIFGYRRRGKEEEKREKEKRRRG